MKGKTHGLLKNQKEKIYWFMMIPVIVIFSLGIILPLVYSTSLSLREYDIFLGKDRFIGIQNYLKIISDVEFQRAILRNVLYTGIVVFANFLIGFAMALVFHRNFCGNQILRGIIILPMLIIPATAAIVWRLMYHPMFGIINQVLGLLGIQGKLWLSNPNIAFYCVLVVDIWAWTPWMFLVLLAGLEGLPEEPIEAARLDGINSWQMVWYIILPMLKPIIAVAVTLKTINTFRAFDYLWVLTRGGPGGSSHILSTFSYSKAFIYLDFGYGSAIAVVTFAISVLLLGGMTVYILRKMELL